MRYIVLDTESEALSTTSQEAADRGCEGVTCCWYDYRQTADGRYCLRIIDDAQAVQGLETTDQEPEWPEPPELT